MEKIILENIEDIFKTLDIKAKDNSPLMVILTDEKAIKHIPTEYICRRPFGRVDLSIITPKRTHYGYESERIINIKLLGYNINFDLDFELTFKSIKKISKIDSGVFFTEHEKATLINTIRKIKLNQI